MSPTLLQSTVPEETGSSSGWLQSEYLLNSSRRADMVVSVSESHQWETRKESSSRHCDSHGCLPPGLGSQLPRYTEWRSLDTRGAISLHINCLELITVWYAVQAFCKGKQNKTDLILIDNTSAVAYINHMGGTRSSRLGQLAVRFWTWALEQGITLKAQHIA